jgi:hypothetical protein
LDKEHQEFALFHWFGDPTMEIWTARPVVLNVDHPVELSLESSSVLVHVEDAAGEPVEGAFVCVWKENELYLRGYTNSEGDTLFAVEPESPGGLFITVTKHNCIPYQGEIEIVDIEPPVTQCTIHGNVVSLSATDNSGVAYTMVQVLKRVNLAGDTPENTHESTDETKQGNPLVDPSILSGRWIVIRDWSQYTSSILLESGYYRVNFYSVDHSDNRETTQTVSFLVGPPLAYNMEVWTSPGQPIDIYLQAWDPDQGPQPLQYEIVNLPSHGILIPLLDPNRVIYSPNQEEWLGGFDSFTFRVFDGEYYSNVAMVSITVSIDPPTR